MTEEDGEEEEGDGTDSPNAADGEVVLPVDGLPLPPDSRTGARMHPLRWCTMHWL